MTDAGRLFALLCEEWLDDPVLAGQARGQLDEVAARLGLPPDEAARIAAKARARPSQPGEASSRGFDAERVYRRACASAWEDGAMQATEQRLLRRLAEALRIAPDRARRLRDAALEGEDEPAAGPGPGPDPGLGDRFGDPVTIGRGGMGTVYRALDMRLGREVAVKVLNQLPGLGSDGERTRLRFLREARVLATLTHPGLPVIYDVADRPTPHIVMELLEGETLQARFADRGPQPPEEVRGWLLQAADVLAHAHSRGVIHRDVKPDNLLLDPRGRIRVLDFGIAMVEDATRMTEVGLGLGTVGYLPPEQITATGMGPHSDVYALAATGYYLVSGRHPYTIPQLAVGRGFSAAPLPAAVDPGLAAALAQALVLDPARRPTSMAAFARALAPGARPDPGSGPASPASEFAGVLAGWKALAAALSTGLSPVMAPLDRGQDPAAVLAGLDRPALARGLTELDATALPGRPRDLVEGFGQLRADGAALLREPAPQALLHVWGSLRAARDRAETWLDRTRVDLGREVVAPLATTRGHTLAPGSASDLEAEEPDEIRSGLGNLLDAVLGDLSPSRPEAVVLTPGPPGAGAGPILAIRAPAEAGIRPGDPLSWSSLQLLGAWVEARGGRLSQARRDDGAWELELHLPAAVGIP